MTDSRFEVRLKQHTPMVHFQHEQDGATLRATELKPKLDRYVRRHLNGNADERLRYQVRIQPLGEPIVNNEKPHGLYFGKVGRARQHDQVTLTVNTYFDAGLAAAVWQAIPECFALENFGTRQNKGFGSFYPDETHTDPPLPAIETVLKSSGKPIYYFGVGKSDEPLDFIEALYKAMKSGINGPRRGDFYFKSLLWRYFNSGPPTGGLITWEKRFMKQSLIDRLGGAGGRAGAGGNTSDYLTDPRFLRVVLGFSDTYTYKYVHIRKLNVTVDRAGPDPDYGDTRSLPLREGQPYVFQASHPDIHRFKSPITFKPVGNRVYIIADPEAYRPVLGEHFRFQEGEISQDLKAPDAFDIDAFLEYVAKEINAFQPAAGITDKMARRLQSIHLQPLSRRE